MNFTAISAMGNPVGQAHELPLPLVPDVSLREHTEFGCVLLSAAVDTTEVAAVAESCLDISLPMLPGAVKTSGDTTSIWLSPRSWLVLCHPAQEATICESIFETFPDRRLHASAFTDYLCWFSLEGSRSKDLLRQGSVISLSKTGLPVGHAKRTLVNDAATVLYRKDENRWMLGVERSRAVYFSKWLNSLHLF